MNKKEMEFVTSCMHTLVFYMEEKLGNKIKFRDMSLYMEDLEEDKGIDYVMEIRFNFQDNSEE